MADFSVPNVVLCGGAEFTAENEALDHAWRRLCTARKPRLALITAAADEPVHIVRAAKRTLSKLDVELLSVQLDPNTPLPDHHPLSDALAGAQFVYLTDGNPIALMDALHKNNNLELLRTAWHMGTVLIASGAGAMALCEYMWNGEGWESGLGFLQGITVLPHHERIAARFSAERLRRDLPEPTVILGIEDATGLALQGTQAQVVGASSVTVYRAGGVQVYASGQHFVPADSIANATD